MIECVLGLLAGWFVGRLYLPPLGGVGGDAALVVFLALADELTAAVADKQRSAERGLFQKFVFCLAVLWVGRWTGAPLPAFAALIFLGSIFMRCVYPSRGSGGTARSHTSIFF